MKLFLDAETIADNPNPADFFEAMVNSMCLALGFLDEKIDYARKEEGQRLAQIIANIMDLTRTDDATDIFGLTVALAQLSSKVDEHLKERMEKTDEDGQTKCAD